MTELLVLYYSRHGTTEALARQICRGVDAVEDCRSRLRSLPPVSADNERPVKAVPDSGAPWATIEDLITTDGLLLGSPTRFGNMAAPVKHFIDQTSSLWLRGGLAGKPAAVFTSTQTMHGGQESTLLSMMVPLLHQGMLIVGLPYTEPLLSTTRSGGSPYGATHVQVTAEDGKLTSDEQQLAQALGRRVATIARTLKAARKSAG